MSAASSSTPTAARISGVVLALVLVVVAALVFALIYGLLPNGDHAGALLLIGAISLVFALVAYLARSVTPSPQLAQSASWGFAGLGFGLLILTIAVNPGSTMSSAQQIVGLIIVLVVLAAALAGVGWRSRAGRAEEVRHETRAAWDNAPAPNALDYPAATPPGRNSGGPGSP